VVVVFLIATIDALMRLQQMKPRAEMQATIPPSILHLTISPYTRTHTQLLKKGIDVLLERESTSGRYRPALT